MAVTSTLPGRAGRTRPAAWARALRRPLGEAAVAVEVVLGTLIVLAAAERRSHLIYAHHGAFTRWFSGPLGGLWPTLTSSPARLHAAFAAAVLAMAVAWLVVVACGTAVRPRVVVVSAVALNVVFLLCPVLYYTDVFNYIGYARMAVAHHLDPYTQLPLLQPGDPVFAYSNWHRLRSPYGPLFTVALMPLAALPLPVAYWGYKLLATLASLGLLAALWRCAGRLGRPPAAAVAFVGLNPVVLVYAEGGKHNDLLMMALVMAGALLLLTRREAAGGVALVAAVAVKVSAALLAPVLILGAARRRGAVAGALGAALGLGAMTLVLFGPHGPDLADQGRLVDSYSLANLLGLALGRGGDDPGLRAALRIVLAASVLVCSAVAWRRRRWVEPAGWAALAGVACASWLMPWYVMWALPFAALSRSRALRIAAVAAVAYVVLIWTGQGRIALHDLGVHPARTAVSHVNSTFTNSLLRDHPRRPSARRRSRHAAGRARPSRRRSASSSPSPRSTTAGWAPLALPAMRAWWCTPTSRTVAPAARHPARSSAEMPAPEHRGGASRRIRRGISLKAQSTSRTGSPSTRCTSRFQPAALSRRRRLSERSRR